MKQLRWLLAALLLFAFVGAACGDDDDSTVGSGETTTTAKDDSAAPPEYTITASESGDAYKFDMPSDIKGGVVTITLDNSKGKEPHDFQLAELEGHTLDDVLKQVASESATLEPWLKHGVGVNEAMPGKSTSATFELKPNTEYAFFCTESNEEKNIPHATHGMSGTFKTGEDSGAAMPESTATIDTSEYKFAIDGLKSGKNTVEFSNKGSMLHHVIIVPFLEGKTLDDLKTTLASQDDSPAAPPVDFEKGSFSAVAGPGQSIVYDLDLAPGHYAILCFMPDPGTAGPPHALKGMVDEFTVS